MWADTAGGLRIQLCNLRRIASLAFLRSLHSLFWTRFRALASGRLLADSRD